MRKLGQRHKEPAVKLKAFVATPAYDGRVYTNYAISLAETCLMASQHEIGVIASIMGNGAFIELARNTFVRKFLETDCTHLFFIDADLKWEARAFVGLMTSGRPVSAGLYRRRQEPESYPVRWVPDDEGGLQILDGGWIPCDRVPTGFLCIERRVIEEMAKEAPMLNITGVGLVPELFYTKVLPLEEENVYSFMGEDFCFSEDYYAKYNEPIYVWPDFDFVHGQYKCNWQHFIYQEVERIAKELKEAQA